MSIGPMNSTPPPLNDISTDIGESILKNIDFDHYDKVIWWVGMSVVYGGIIAAVMAKLVWIPLFFG